MLDSLGVRLSNRIGAIFPVCILFTVLLLLCPFSSYSQQDITIAQLNERIESLDRANDTTQLAIVFEQANQHLQNHGIPEDTKDVLSFRMLETRHLINYSKIKIDSGIRRYLRIRELANRQQLFDIEALALGRIANAYRSKRQMGDAFEYNQKEIAAANLNGDPLLLGRALITELDISYNSLPWPIQKEDLSQLVELGEGAIAYAEEHSLESILPFGKLYVSKFYIKQGEYRRADSILQSISDSEPLPIAFSKYEHLCEIAKETKDLDLYAHYTQEFKTRAYATKRPFVALNAHNYLLDYALQANQADSARFYAGKLEQNLAEVDTTKYLDFLDISYTTLARYYEDKDVEKELQYLSYSAEINRIIAARQRVAFMAIKKYKDQVADLEEENSTLSQVNQFLKNNFLLLIGISIALVLLVFLLYRKYYRARNRMAAVSEEKEQIASKVLRKSIELNNKQRVYLEELKFIKADKNYVEFHTSEKKFVDRNTLSTVMDELPPNFIQVHRSYVINRNFIKLITGTTVMLLPGIEIPISRTYKAHLKKVM